MRNGIRTEEGFALITAVVITTLLLALGGTALIMSQMGYLSLSSEKKYQLASWAAEYAVQNGALSVVNTGTCPGTTSCTGLTSGATCSYFSIADSTNTFCFINGRGQFGAANVAKTMVIPRASSIWGGMVTKGGTITLSGSSAIAGCDDDESTYASKCGVMPALIGPSSGLTISSSSTTLTSCQNEGTLQGLSGNPPQYNIDLPDDLTPSYFNVSDTNGDGTAWDEFLASLETVTGAEFYPSLPGTPAPTDPIPAGCQYSTGSACCQTASSTQINCYGTSGCTGAVVKTIDLNSCQNPSGSGIPYIQVSGAGTTLRVGHSNVTLQVASATPVTVTANIAGLNLATGGAVTIGSNLSSGSSDAASAIYAGGSITVTSNVGHSGSTTNLVSAGTVTIDLGSHTTVTDANVFGNNLSVELDSSTAGISGGVYYAQTGSVIDANGGPSFGTTTNPVMLLAGSTSLSVPGNLTINGLVYTSATTVSLTGAVELQGSLVNTSTSANVSNTGNGTIQFNKSVLDSLYGNYSSVMNQPKCGGGNKNSYAANTKMTVF
ncbi:MAG: hypothetical protein U0411_01055 [Thermodesulfovibrionales bacterium]